MSLIGVAVALLVLAAITQVGVFLIERSHAPGGRMIDVTGGRLHVVELGQQNSSSLPIVLIHGASSNLESMRQPLGDLLARNHRVILIDRPGHGWSTREALSSSTPAIQARMIDEALGKLGIDRALIVGHSWGGAVVAAMAVEHPSRVAGLVLLAAVTHPWPGGVAWYHNLGATPVLGPLFAHTLALPAGALMINPGARGAFLPQAMPDELCARHGARAGAAAARVSRQCVGHGDAEGRGHRADAALRRDQGAGGDHPRRRGQIGASRQARAAVREGRAACRADRAARHRPPGAECRDRARSSRRSNS